MHHLGWSHHHVKESLCQPWHPARVSKVHATWEYMGADNVFGKPACWVIMSGSYYHLLRGEDLLCGGEHLQLYHNFPSNQPPFPTRRPFQQFIANSGEQLFCIISQIGYCLLYFPMSSLNGECVDFFIWWWVCWFFHHVMKELTFHNVVKVQSLCCLCPSAVAQKSLTHDVPTCL